MKKVLRVALFLSSTLVCASLFAQAPFSFTNSNNRLVTPGFHSGVAVSVADMDEDGMDDIARMDQGYDLYMELQKCDTPKTHFTSTHAGATGGGSAWSMVVGDVDNNGKRDVAVGFGSSAALMKSNAAFNTFTLSALPNSNFFLQNMNFVDVNNDGWLDIFGCNDNAASRMWGNNGAGAFPDTTEFFLPNAFPVTDNSGNYGSIWTDFDNDGDLDLYVIHCRQGTANNDQRRANELFINDGTNHFHIDSFDAHNLVQGTQMSWTANFEDIDNDGDLDVMLSNYGATLPQILLNDGTGHYTDITVSAGFVANMWTLESQMADLDNDGFVDVILTGDNTMIFHNNGNRTFTLIPNLLNTNVMETFATGDLNHDGKLDIYGGYGNIYTTPSGIDDVVWLNTTANNNHFVTIWPEGTVSNRDASGARVEVYGAWGKQIREVHNGESYSTTNSLMVHFGLGTATTIDSIIVRWPSHQISRIYNRAVDQFIHIVEGQCASPDNVITFSGPSLLCSGQTVTLNAPAGGNYAYLWSTGATTQTITTGTAGDYNVKVTENGNACFSVAKTVTIQISPDQTPSIQALGDTTFCEGSSVVLQGIIQPYPTSGYLWSNGDTTQTTTVSQPGTYTLTIQGVCASYTSAPVTINNIVSHVSNVTNAAVCDSGMLSLGATGTGSLYWFDAATSGNLVTTGTSYTTPVITSNTTYYVESHDTTGGITGIVGPIDTAGGAAGLYTGDQSEIFDVLAPCVLTTVKMYSGSAQTVHVELRDNTNITVLQSANINVPIGMSVDTLNFNLTPGTGYNLGWTVGSAPNLYRSTLGSVYPYTISNVISVTGNTAGLPARWYGYYDWHVTEPPVTCISNRVPVTATVNTSPTVTMSGLSSTYLDTDPMVTLTGTPAGGTFSGPGVSGNIFDPATAGAGGPYTVTYSYTDGNGCSGTTTYQVTVNHNTVGIKETDFSRYFSVYPNPSSGNVNIFAKENISGAFEIKVYDVHGKLLLNRNFNNMNSGTIETIDLNEYAKGLYTISIMNAEIKHSVKISVQ